MSRWSEVTTIKFVEAYRDWPCLWNVKDAIYKNKHARDAAYKEIENIMNIEGFGIMEIKNKIRALRSTYSQEKKKIKDSKKSGAGTNQVYVPGVKWFKEMDSFLHQLEDNKRQTEDNLTVQPEQQKNITGEEVTDDTNLEEMGDNIIEEDNVHQPATKKRRLGTKVKQISSVVQDLKRITETVVREPEMENEYVIFGRSIAAQLMKLSPYSAIQAQDRIQSVLTELKLQDLQRHSNASSIASYVNTPLQSPSEEQFSVSEMSGTCLQQTNNYSTSDIIHQAFHDL
ncbi:hypothetical protein FQR65_LT15065 [Abscondita terminalis]|nr:hypothetical protein FQR65_LT15065 [Abscondita terminalis]